MAGTLPAAQSDMKKTRVRTKTKYEIPGVDPGPRQETSVVDSTSKQRSRTSRPVSLPPT